MSAPRALTKWDLAPLTVYRVVESEKVVCSLGETHERKLVARKFLGPVVDSVLHDNGYGADYVPVRLDAQGRRYEARYPIDFHGSTTWWCAAVGLFDNRPPRNLHRFLAPNDIRLVATLELAAS